MKDKKQYRDFGQVDFEDHEIEEKLNQDEKDMFELEASNEM